MENMGWRVASKLDCTGQLCPVPIIMTEERIADLKIGDVVEVTFTDPGAKPDLLAWCKVHRHECLRIDEDKRSGRAYIRKGL